MRTTIGNHHVEVTPCDGLDRYSRVWSDQRYVGVLLQTRHTDGSDVWLAMPVTPVGQPNRCISCPTLQAALVALVS